MLGHSKLTYDELITVLTGIESMMNSRPLTYLSDENVEAITPYHLLHGRNITARRDGILHEYQNVGNSIKGRVVHIRTVLAQYWSRFCHEYIYALRERMIYDKEKRTEPKLTVNDVVIIVENSVKVIWSDLTYRLCGVHTSTESVRLFFFCLDHGFTTLRAYLVIVYPDHFLRFKI